MCFEQERKNQQSTVRADKKLENLLFLTGINFVSEIFLHLFINFISFALFLGRQEAVQ
jgi:hypothetical protein